MNIYNLSIKIPKLPVLDLKPLQRFKFDDEDEEFYDTTTVPLNTPCIEPNKRVKYSSQNDLYPFDTIDEFLQFHSE